MYSFILCRVNCCNIMAFLDCSKQYCIHCYSLFSTATQCTARSKDQKETSGHTRCVFVPETVGYCGVLFGC